MEFSHCLVVTFSGEKLFFVGNVHLLWLKFCYLLRPIFAFFIQKMTFSRRLVNVPYFSEHYTFQELGWKPDVTKN